jgi:hypothetical protein
VHHAPMAATLTTTIDRRRRALEAAGWRTWLEYQENHHRAEDGRMVAVDARWVVELERGDGASIVVAAASPAAAWRRAGRLAG